MRRALPSITAFLAAFTLTCAAAACPRCAEGIEARARVWTEGFASNLLLALAPFVLIGAGSAWANRIGKPRPAARGTAMRG